MLQRLMDRNSAISRGRSFFGIKHILVLFRRESRMLSSKKDPTSWNKSFPTKSQNCWKNKAVNTSGAGAFRDASGIPLSLPLGSLLSL